MDDGLTATILAIDSDDIEIFYYYYYYYYYYWPSLHPRRTDVFRRVSCHRSLRSSSTRLRPQISPFFTSLDSSQCARYFCALCFPPSFVFSSLFEEFFFWECWQWVVFTLCVFHSSLCVTLKAWRNRTTFIDFSCKWKVQSVWRYVWSLSASLAQWVGSWADFESSKFESALHSVVELLNCYKILTVIFCPSVDSELATLHVLCASVDTTS